jgi:acyl-CoA synthetase (AMP-forming)/AMP-acid ligase II
MAIEGGLERLEALLNRCAGKSSGIILYGADEEAPEYLSYNKLRDAAQSKARYLQDCHNVGPGSIVLVHFQSHKENILWFWASILAGGVPAMSTPLVKDRQGRDAHLEHLKGLLFNPVVVTTKDLLASDFDGNILPRVVAVDVCERSSGFESTYTAHGRLDSKSRPIVPDSGDECDGTIPYNAPGAQEKAFGCQKANAEYPVPSPHKGTLIGAASDTTSDYMYKTVTECVHEELRNDTITAEATGGDASIVDSTHHRTSEDPMPLAYTSLDDVAALMLTSGSTGNAKAVCLTHEQILTACAGKLASMPLPQDAVLLNWIGLDHVGSLVELHLTGMLAGVDQVHIPAAKVILAPLVFLRLLSEHRVVMTFAPNFFLSKLQHRLDSATSLELQGIDLKHLHYLVSGGEPNDVQTCVRVSDHLRKLGAPTTTTLTPGFGMTETCAGSIYSRECPSIDIAAATEFAALGTCVPGIEMRVSRRLSSTGEGSLEVQGPIVFQRYFNNAKATREAFTEDGWFITGDSTTGRAGERPNHREWREISSTRAGEQYRQSEDPRHSRVFRTLFRPPS